MVALTLKVVFTPYPCDQPRGPGAGGGVASIYRSVGQPTYNTPGDKSSDNWIGS